MFERQLEDVSPADTAEVDLLRRPVRGAAQHQELWANHVRQPVGVGDRGAAERFMFTVRCAAPQNAGAILQ